MIDFFSWSQAAVLSPSQCPAQRPEEGNVERVMMIPRSPVTSCTALLGEEQENSGQSSGKKAIGLWPELLGLALDDKMFAAWLEGRWKSEP
jgi:hypothetical protein